MRTWVGLGLAVTCWVLAGCGDETSATVAPQPVDTSASAAVSATPGTSPAPSTTAPPSTTPSSTREEVAAIPSEPVSTEVVDAAPETVAGYQALGDGLTAMFEKAAEIEKESPDVNPQGADEIKEVVGDVFPDGVDLVTFEEEGEAGAICLTGPATTFVLLGQRGEGLRQIYGEGDCDEASSRRRVEDGDVVVDLDFELTDEERPQVRFVLRVVKGQNIVDDAPELVEFVEVLNRSVAPQL